MRLRPTAPLACIATAALAVAGLSPAAAESSARQDRPLVKVVTDHADGTSETRYVERPFGRRAGAVRAAASYPHRVYVAKVTNQGPYSVSDATAAGWVDQSLARWRAESAGRISSYARVGGIKPFTAGSCTNQNTLWNAADDQFPGVDFGAPGNHLLVLVPASPCVFGVATVGSSIADGGEVAISVGSDQGLFLQGLLHELGHNIGLEHANSRLCDPTSTCTASAYGNWYDFMGISIGGFRPTALQSASRVQLGLTQTCEVPTLALAAGQRTVSATYDVFSRAAGTGTRGLQLTDPDDNTVYYLEWRNRAGWDSAAYYGTGSALAQPNVFDTGITVARKAGAGTVLYSYPKPGGGRLFSRKTGETFSRGGTEVRVDSTSGSAAQVTVTLTDPSVVSAPTLPAQSGSARVTGTVQARGTAVAGTRGWTAGACFRHQWYVDGAAVPGAIGSTFPLSAAMKGRRIQVRLVGQRTGYQARTALSPALVVLGSFTKAPKPKLKGKTKVGRKLRVVRGAWSPAPDTFTYEWYAGKKRVKGAKKPTLHLTRAMKGKRIKVVVTAKRSGYASISKASHRSGKVR